MSLSVIVITRNEERNIAACLESVAWADQVVVVDSGSRDRTAEIARQYTNCVHVTGWKGYGEAKNFAMEQVTNDWVLWLDADERVTAELRSEIDRVVKIPGNRFAGYRVSRRAYFLGKWIKRCGWYPGYVVRLFRRESSRFTTTNVHETVEVRGAIGTLRGDLLHHTDETIHHYLTKFNRYTSLAAVDLRETKRAFSVSDVLARPAYTFVKMYFLRRGFLDGMHGLVLSLLSAAYVFAKYAKLWELERAAQAMASDQRFDTRAG